MSVARASSADGAPRVAVHVAFALGHLPWFFFLPVAFMAFGAPGLEDDPFVRLAQYAYLAYPGLFVASVAASLAWPRPQRANRWARAVACLPVLSPLIFLLCALVVLARH